MNTAKLNHILENQKYDFGENFSEDVIRNLQAPKTKPYHMPIWFWGSVAACIALCMVMVYFQDGVITTDSLLGLAELENQELIEYIEYQQYEQK